MERFIYNDTEYEYIKYQDFSTDILPIKEEYKKSGYINLHCAFDIETSRINENYTTMYIWQFAINEITIIGRTWKEFIKLLEQISDYYALVDNNIYLRVWIQNASYEWSFLRKWLKFKYDFKRKQYKVFATEERKVVYFVTENNIEFRDSYILTGRALSGYAKTYNLKHGKLSGDLDYSKIRNSKTKMTDQELAYCIEDVQTLAEWDKVYITREFLRNKKQIPLTSTGIVRAEMQANFKAMSKTERIKMKKILADSFPDETLYNTMINWLYRGGFVHSNSEYVDEVQIGHDMGSFDKKSSYPASAMQEKFPYKFVKRYPEYFYKHVADETGIHYNYQMWNDQAFISVLTFTNIKRRTQHSIESKNKLYDYENALFDNGRLMQADSITVVLNEIDFKVYMMMYEWESIECHSMLIADKDYLPKYLLDMFLKYFYLKETIEDKSSTDYILSKYKLNSLYGMAVTSLYNKNVKLNNNGDLEITEGEKDYGKLKSGKILLPQWGIWISSISRESEVRIHYMTCKGYDEKGNKIVKPSNSLAMYGDTDSCKMQNITGMSEMIEQYNNKLRRKNKKMNTGEYPKEIYKNLGCFEFEEVYKKFVCLGSKRYMGTYIAKDKKTGKYGLKTSVTVAGLPKGALENYARKTDHDIYKLFTFGMCVPKEYSKKKCVNYCDDYQEETVTDYQGNTCDTFELSCCTLNEIAFEMDLNTDYIDIVRFAVEQRKDERRYARNGIR